MANTDDDNLAELLDDDKLEDSQYPPDRPLGAEDRGVTDVEDSVDERRRRENPDWMGSGRPDDVGDLVDQGGELGVDDEADAVADEARSARDPLWRDTTTQDREEIQSAEEAAMHLTSDPPMDDDDGYVEDSGR